MQRLTASVHGSGDDLAAASRRAVAAMPDLTESRSRAYDEVMRFLKGHGTENDFVVLPDPEGTLDLGKELAAEICHRRRGVGADGVLRAVRTKAAPEMQEYAGRAEWFMDYRNADGSIAEMCGNGVRVYGRYLVEAGLAAPGELPIATRSGVKHVNVDPDGDVSVDMGRPYIGDGVRAEIAGVAYDGLQISLGNPHLACMVSEPLANVDLSQQPIVDSEAFPGGVNVEVVREVEDGHVAMRVFERGSGETRSCGTGAVAAAVAAAQAAGRQMGSYRVDVPGGRLTVTLDEETTYLAGPALLVAEGELRPAKLASTG